MSIGRLVGKPEVWDPAEAWKKPFGLASGIRTRGIREINSLLSHQKFPVRIQPNWTKLRQNAHKHWREPNGNAVSVEKFPVFFPVNGNLDHGEQFAPDCIHRHKVIIINKLGEKLSILLNLPANLRDSRTQWNGRALSAGARCAVLSALLRWQLRQFPLNVAQWERERF